MPATVLAVVADVLLYARIRETALQLGVEVRRVEPAGLSAEVAAHRTAVAIVELDPERPEHLEAARALKADPARAGVRVIAFGAHTQPALLQAARDAGGDAVMPRSEFVARLPALLADSNPPRIAPAPSA